MLKAIHVYKIMKSTNLCNNNIQTWKPRSTDEMTKPYIVLAKGLKGNYCSRWL